MSYWDRGGSLILVQYRQGISGQAPDRYFRCIRVEQTTTAKGWSEWESPRVSPVNVWGTAVLVHTKTHNTTDRYFFNRYKRGVMSLEGGGNRKKFLKIIRIRAVDFLDISEGFTNYFSVVNDAVFGAKKPFDATNEETCLGCNLLIRRCVHRF